MDYQPNNKGKNFVDKTATIFSKFNSPDNFEIITFNPSLDQKLAINNWRLAHQEFREQWAILRQTSEYNAYYKGPKKNRLELKTKRNATKEGIAYLQSKATALSLLSHLPSVKIRGTLFKIVAYLQNYHYVAFNPMVIKYNDF